MLWTGKVLAPDSHVLLDAAAARGVEPALVLAFAEVESGFRVAAYNPEPRWRYLWDVAKWAPWREATAAEMASEVPPADFPAPPGVDRDAEWWGQQASWGPLQLMGSCAREMGCTAFFLPELAADPVLSVDLGCKFLRRKVDRYAVLADAVSAFNAGHPTWQDPGGNKTYVAKVLAAYERHRTSLNAGGKG